MSIHVMQKVDECLLSKMVPAAVVKLLKKDGIKANEIPTTLQISNRGAVLKKDRSAESPFRIEDLSQLRQHFKGFVIDSQEVYDAIGKIE